MLTLVTGAALAVSAARYVATRGDDEAPVDTRVPVTRIVPAAGQSFVTGEIESLSADDTQTTPIPVPFTLTSVTGAGGVAPLVARPLPLHRVAAHPVLLQPLEQVAQGVAADGPQAPGRELQPSLPVLDESGLGEHPSQLRQPLQAGGAVVAQQVARHVEVDLGQGAGRRGRRQQVLELVEVAQPLHQVDRPGHAERVAAPRLELPPPPLPRERPLEVLLEAVDLPAQVHVVE